MLQHSYHHSLLLKHQNKRYISILRLKIFCSLKNTTSQDYASNDSFNLNYFFRWEEDLDTLTNLIGEMNPIYKIQIKVAHEVCSCTTGSETRLSKRETQDLQQDLRILRVILSSFYLLSFYFFLAGFHFFSTCILRTFFIRDHKRLLAHFFHVFDILIELN